MEGGAALELERGQPGRDLVQAGPVLVQRGQGLVGLGQHDRDVLEDVLAAVDVERDDLAALGDGHDQGAGLLGDALRGAVPGAGLHRQDRRVRHQLDVGPGDLGGVGGQADRAVHLGHLVEQRRRVVDFELDAAREQERELLRVANDDEAAGLGVDDVVDPLTERRAGSNHLQRLYEPGLLACFELSELFPGSRGHQGHFSGGKGTKRGCNTQADRMSKSARRLRLQGGGPDRDR